MIALVRTIDGVFEVDLDEEVVLGLVDAEVVPEPVDVGLPRVVGAARCGSTVIAVLDRRPPLAISNDAGRTWREAGGGLPAGYAARNRLYLSEDGGRFWRSLAPELPAIEALAVS